MDIDATTIRRTQRVGAIAVATALMAGLLASGAHAQEQPSAAMMEPVRGLVAFMSTLRRGVCIIENFAPYLFCGLQAAANWAAAFRAHAASDDLKDLHATFGAPHDFSQSGKTAYFSLPTTWTGQTHGRHFEEQGAWAFVLEQEGSRWRIAGYGWGVTGEHLE